MKIYRIFLKKNNKGVIENLEMIKEGFNIYAFIFNIFFLLYKKLWKEFFIIFFIIIVLNIFEKYFISSYVIIPIQLCLCVFISFEYQDWITKKMIKTGYQFLGYSSGNTIREAKLKFLDNLNENYKNDDKLEQKVF